MLFRSAPLLLFSFFSSCFSVFSLFSASVFSAPLFFFSMPPLVSFLPTFLFFSVHVCPFFQPKNIFFNPKQFSLQPKNIFFSPKPFCYSPKPFSLFSSSFFFFSFQLTCALFFSPKRFCLSPQYFFSLAQKILFSAQNIFASAQDTFSVQPKNLSFCGSTPPSFCFFSSCLSFLPLATTYCPFSAQVFSSKPFSAASCLFI